MSKRAGYKGAPRTASSAEEAAEAIEAQVAAKAEELSENDEIIGVWSELGWFRWLPNCVIVVDELFAIEESVSREQFSSAVSALEGERLFGSPLWAIAPPPEAEDEVAAAQSPAEVKAEDAEIRAVLSARHDRWLSSLARRGIGVVESADDLVDALIELGLLLENDAGLWLSPTPGDPIQVLEASEDDARDEIRYRLDDDAAELDDLLFDMFFEPERDEFATTTRRLAQECGTDTEFLTLVLADLIDDPDTGYSAERFGPLDGAAIRALEDHQKFTFRLDPRIRDDVMSLAQQLESDVEPV
jgi:hypothetical protein